MQVSFIISFLFLISDFGGTNDEWGFFGHKKINELAIYALPNEIGGFYKAHSKEIIEWSVAPDQRRYVVEEEGMKHYIDLDLYDSFPLPKYWNQAVDKYGKEYLESRGVVPWNTFFVYHSLVKAMAAKDYKRIIKISADLGHYVADSHVPLHTTSNYNGQFTDQLGIHAFWESRLPELYFDSYDLFTERASYIEDVQSELWATVMESNVLLDSVFQLEQEITKRVGEDKKYAHMQRGKKVIRMPSEYYTSKFNDEGGGLVEQRMKKSIHRVSSLWFSAWIDAGQPKLNELALFDKVEEDSVGKTKSSEPSRDHDY